jgi:hypothetical protein
MVVKIVITAFTVLRMENLPMVLKH